MNTDLLHVTLHPLHGNRYMLHPLRKGWCNTVTFVPTEGVTENHSKEGLCDWPHKVEG